MYSNSFQFNFEDFQPFFLYIRKCRMFEDELICLNPRFLVRKEDDKFVAIRDDGYVDLISDNGLDLIAICGRNGLGKTTLLRIMQAQNFPGDKDYTLFWKDVNGNILATDKATVMVDGKEIVLNEDMMHVDSIGALCGNQAAGTVGLDTNSLERGIVQVYQANPKLYDEGTNPLFDGFYIGYSPDFFEESHSLGDFYSRMVDDPLASLDFPPIIKEHPTLHVLADIAQDNTFENLLKFIAERGFWSCKRLAKLLMDNESRALDAEILRLLYVDGRVLSALESLGQADTRRMYDFEQYRTTSEAIERLSKRVDDWIRRKLEKFRLHLWDGRLRELLWDHPFKNQPDGSKSKLSDLSSGEYQRLRMRYLVAPYLFQDQIGWFYFDDADARLHPEWSRRYVFDLVTAFAQTARRVKAIKGKPKAWKRRLSCILVTHSPFILSDLMPQNILLLRADGKRTRVERGNSETFAGNIGQMFHTEFFMETTVGEFARQAIKKAIKTLEDSPTAEELEQIRKLFSMIGDDVLKNLLLEKLRHAENRA